MNTSILTRIINLLPWIGGNLDWNIDVSLLHICMYVMYAMYVCMSCMSCMSCMYVMYVCHVCMSCMYVCHVCHVCIDDQGARIYE